MSIERGQGPQIAWSEPGQQWTPRGGAHRRVIDDGGGDDPVIEVDDKELSWMEFGRAGARGVASTNDA